MPIFKKKYEIGISYEPIKNDNFSKTPSEN